MQKVTKKAMLKNSIKKMDGKGGMDAAPLKNSGWADMPNAEQAGNAAGQPALVAPRTPRPAPTATGPMPTPSSTMGIGKSLRATNPMNVPPMGSQLSMNAPGEKFQLPRAPLSVPPMKSPKAPGKLNNAINKSGVMPQRTKG